MKTQIGDNCWYNCKPPICSIPNVKLSHSFTPPEQQKNTTRVFLLLVYIVPLERILWKIWGLLPSHTGSHSLIARMTRQKS